MKKWQLGGIAAAMAALDFERALEMTRELPDDRDKLNPSPRAGFERYWTHRSHAAFAALALFVGR